MGANFSKPGQKDFNVSCHAFKYAFGNGSCLWQGSWGKVNLPMWTSLLCLFSLMQLKETSSLNVPRTFLVSGKQRSLELQARYRWKTGVSLIFFSQSKWIAFYWATHLCDSGNSPFLLLFLSIPPVGILLFSHLNSSCSSFSITSQIRLIGQSSHQRSTACAHIYPTTVLFFFFFFWDEPCYTAAKMPWENNGSFSFRTEEEKRDWIQVIQYCCSSYILLYLLLFTKQIYIAAQFTHRDIFVRTSLKTKEEFRYC